MSNTRPIWSSSSTSGLGSSDDPSNASTISTSNTNPQEWCLHAQLTIRHPTGGTGKMILRPTTTATLTGNDLSSPSGTNERTIRTGNLNFQCSWENSGESIMTEVIPMESGIQKFESWLQSHPPSLQVISCPTSKNPLFPTPSKFSTGQSKKFPLTTDPIAPQSPPFSNVFKPRLIQPYERRCKSTCSITLTSNNSMANAATLALENRCASVESERASSLPPVKPVLKDAETQTMSRINPPKVIQKLFSSNKPMGDNINVMGCKIGSSSQDFVDPVDTGSLNFTKSLKNRSSGSNVERMSRKLLRSTSQSRAKSSPPVHQQKGKQPTIHIDVYCTGSDVSTNTEDNASSSETDSTSTSQTVYESPQYKISHHSKKKQMPVCFTSNVADLVNLATNQIKLQNRQDKARIHTPGGSKGKLITNNSLDHVNPKSQLNNPLTQTSSPHHLMGSGLDKLIKERSCDSLSTSYPSSVGISRNTTTTSFASDWTHLQSEDLNDNSLHRGGGRREREEDELSQEFLFSSKSRSMDSASTPPKSYKYCDSLEGSPSPLYDKNDNSKHSFPQHNEQWWLDYIFKKFNLKDKEDANALQSPNSEYSKMGKEPPTNLLKMKRLSIPNYDLVDGFNMEDMILPPFMPIVPKETDQGDTLLVTAAKFGSLVKNMKKPGHHITGPAKNPNCPCQHCIHHFSENSTGGY